MSRKTREKLVRETGLAPAIGATAAAHRREVALFEQEQKHRQRAEARIIARRDAHLYMDD
jgi:hypothetical protein